MPSLGVKSRGAVKKDVHNRVLGLHREVCAMGTFMGKNFSRRRAWREQQEGRARGDSCVGAWSGGSRGGAGLTAEAWRGHGWAKRSSQVCARPLMKYCTSGHSTLCTERALEGHAEVDVA